MTGINRNTIMNLGVRVGNTCAKIMDQEMRGLNCSRIETDELWGYIGKKDRNVKLEDVDKGSVWTWVAIDAETKLVPCFLVGKRDSHHATAFMKDLASRLNGRVQISTDGFPAYHSAIIDAFGTGVDYGKIVKTFAEGDMVGKYSPGVVVDVKKTAVCGKPEQRHISTSYVERQNLTIRMHNRRMTRLTNAFSKKWENFAAAMALHFAYYNFVKAHGSLKCTPAMAAGVTSSFWSVGDLVDMASK